MTEGESTDQPSTDKDSGSGNDEIDYHLKMFGKRPDEFRYSDEFCPFCNSRIDELGWCGCGTIGGG